MNIPIEPLLTVDQISVTFKDGREDLAAKTLKPWKKSAFH